jgi:ubiquinone/menaquinone biosynthesis C-methylase UbiE
LVIHGAAHYDFLVWLYTLGGERRLRERILRLARLQPGEAVLDIGCGTGTLAILAKRQVGAGGAVTGVDASPEMIARARAKARRAGVDVTLAEGAAQALPLPDSTVDVVLSTLMLHHVPRKARSQVVREIKRVLRPGGRILAVDFAKPPATKRSFIDRLHRHGFTKLDEIIAELEAAGLGIIDSGSVGERNLHFVLAAVEPDLFRVDARSVEGYRASQHSMNQVRKPWRLAAAAMAGVLALVALHAGAALPILAFSSDLGSNALWYAVIAALALLVVVKIAVFRLTRRFGAPFHRTREERSDED